MSRYQESEFPAQLHCKISNEMFDKLRDFANEKGAPNGFSNVSHWVRKWIGEGLAREGSKK